MLTPAHTTRRGSLIYMQLNTNGGANEMIISPSAMKLAVLRCEVVRAHLSVPSLISVEHTRSTLLFVDLLDDISIMPLVVISHTGEIGLCWEQGVKKLLIVPESDGVHLHYWVSFGSEQRQGVSPFGPCIPTFVQEILDEFKPLFH